MKHVPVLGKFVAIMAASGIFTIAVAFYATSQIRSIDSSYSGMISHLTKEAILITRANRAAQNARAAIGDLLVSTTDDGNRRAAAELQSARRDFAGFMDGAVAATQNNGAADRDMKTRGLQIIDGDCAETVRLAAAATAPAAVLQSQAVYLRDCSPKFPPYTVALKSATDQLTAAMDKDSAALTATSNTTIALTYGLILGGLAVVMAGGFLAIRGWIARPLKGLAGTMERLARGDLQAEVTGADRRDEIGAMSGAVQVFKDAALEKIRLENETAEARRRPTRPGPGAKLRSPRPPGSRRWWWSPWPRVWGGSLQAT